MKRLVRDNWRWWLILSCVPLFATKTLFNAPMAVMMILGIVTVVRTPDRILRDPSLRLLGLLFLCFEVPILVSLPDAVALRRAASTALVDLRFYFAGIFVIDTLKDARARRCLFAGTVIIGIVWCADALLQMLLGRDLLGYPYNGSRPTGIFHPKYRIGTVTAALFPVLLEGIRRYAAIRRLAWLALPVVLAVIVLSGNRNAWLMLAAGLLGYGVYLAFLLDRRTLVRAGGGSLAVLALVLIAAFRHPAFQQRVDQTLGLFRDDPQAVDMATGMRLSLWKTAWNMYRAHWINGVGPRGFRYDYLRHAGPDDYWVANFDPGEQKYPQSHPHQMLLEVMAETGTIGLIGYLLLLALLINGLRTTPSNCRMHVWPWGVATLVAWFPGNAHMALYASYWGTIAWWLLLVTVGMREACRRERA